MKMKVKDEENVFFSKRRRRRRRRTYFYCLLQLQKKKKKLRRERERRREATLRSPFAILPLRSADREHRKFDIPLFIHLDVTCETLMLSEITIKASLVVR